MKSLRHSAILDIIERDEIDTQEELVRRLNKMGLNVTQATVSRDIRELKLVKVLAPSGEYRYAAPAAPSAENIELYESMFKHTVKSIDQAGNIIVIHTLSGSANAAAEMIDKMGIEDIVGTIAGDNTIFIALRSAEHAPDILRQLRRLTR